MPFTVALLPRQSSLKSCYRMSSPCERDALVQTVKDFSTQTSVDGEVTFTFQRNRNFLDLLHLPLICLGFFTVAVFLLQVIVKKQNITITEADFLTLESMKPFREGFTKKKEAVLLDFVQISSPPPASPYLDNLYHLFLTPMCQQIWAGVSPSQSPN